MPSLTDKITDTRNAARPNSARVSSPRSAGGTTLACDNLTGWPTASKVHFVTYQIDSNSNPVAGTQLDAEGIVSGSNIGSFTVLDGTDNGNSVGDVVEMLPTASWGQDLADALTTEHNRDGTHNDALFDKIYPVGSIYVNATNSTNPATLLGFGTWSAFGAGRVMVGLDSGQTEFDTIGETGGENTHILTTAEMPSHAHTAGDGTGYVVGGATGSGASIAQTGASFRTVATSNNTGGGGAHNNLQPYIVVYMWKRTA